MAVPHKARTVPILQQTLFLPCEGTPVFVVSLGRVGWLGGGVDVHACSMDNNGVADTDLNALGA
jgi:hypothetical protein